MNIKIDTNFRFSVASMQYLPSGELSITLVSDASPASLITTAYDVLDRTTSTVCPLNVTTQAAYSIGYDQGGHRRFVTAMTDPNGNVTTQYADYEGRKVQVTDAAGGITLMHYDNLGQLVSTSDPEGFPTAYEYDLFGRMTKRTHPDAGETRYTYDPAGNLTRETNPLGEINYDYTYYRLLKKRYNGMTGNDVTYTYGTSGTERGRPIRITDGSGMYECQYDSLGNVTEETRTIALPNHNEVYRFRTSYQYDSWGRMLSMTYPDGEEVAYTYLWGGDLYSMHGTKGANHRVYVSKILYNTFGQRSQVEYGNQTKAYYTYDALHRLVNLKSRNGSGTLMQDISYTFDSASNVTRIANSAGVVNSLGGGYANAYRYDALHRLVWSSDSGDLGNYGLDMGYTPSGRIGKKNRSAHTETLSESVGAVYGYCDQHQPHAVLRIFDADNGTLHDLRWDGAGNLGQISTANEGPLFESGRFLFWTEDSRMHSAVDDKYHSYYAYDHGGERRLKLTGTNNVVDVNADHMSTHSVLDSPTLYPSAYMVVTSKGYTKHYYAGAERVAARIGGGWSDGPVPLAGGDDSLRAKADLLYTQSLGQTNGRVLEENDPGCVYGPLVESEGLNAQIEEIPSRLQAVAEADYGTFTEAMHRLVEGGPGGLEREVYFYHSDHLGSASWITDSAGQAIQHLQYLPYGEPYVNQRTSGYSERFTFTGKERDGETGYGYFGARYMDHEILATFLSVDRYADKYPFISPYAYCLWNPIRLTDPSGDTVIFKTAAAKEIHNKYYSINEKYTSLYNELNKQKNIAFVIEKRESNQKAAASYRIEGGIVEQLFPEEGEPYYEYEEVYRVEWGLPGPELGGDESHVYLEEIYHAYQILEYGSNEGTIEREIQAKEFAISVNSAIQVSCTDSYGRQDVPTQLGVISKKNFDESCRFLKCGRKGVTIRDSWGNVMHNAVIPGAYSGFPIR